MRHSLACLISTSTALLAAGSAGAAVITAQLIVDGGSPIPLPSRLDGKISIIDDQACTTGGSEGLPCVFSSAGNWEVQIVAELNPDPSIVYGLAITDFGAPSTFALIFSQSITAVAAPGSVSASLSGNTTNGGGVAGPVTITAMAPPGGVPVDSDLVTELQVYTLSQDGGTTLLSAGQDLGPSFTSSAILTSDVYGPFNEGPAAGPAGAGSYDFMRLDVNFGLSGGGDLVGLGGSATLTPEPASAAMLALGLVGLAALRRPSR